MRWTNVIYVRDFCYWMLLLGQFLILRVYIGSQNAYICDVNLDIAVILFVVTFIKS